MEPKEIEAQLKSFSVQMDEMKSINERNKKEFELKLLTADNAAKDYKAMAEKNAEELRQFKADAEKRETEAKKALIVEREKNILEFAAKLIKEGKITPAQEGYIVSFMKSLTSEADIITFNDKAGRKISHNQLSFFKELISGFGGKRVDFSEMKNSSEKIESETPGDNEQAEEHFMDVRQEGVVRNLPVSDFDLSAKAFEYQADQKKTFNRDVSYGDALVAVQKKSLTKK